MMPGVKVSIDDDAVPVVERFNDAIFELAAAFGRLAGAVEEHNNRERLRTGVE